MFFWGDPKFIVVGMVPNFSNVFPVSYDAVTDRVAQVEYTFL